jgi:hypothetical protein
MNRNIPTPIICNISNIAWLIGLLALLSLVVSKVSAADEKRFTTQSQSASCQNLKAYPQMLIKAKGYANLPEAKERFIKLLENHKPANYKQAISDIKANFEQWQLDMLQTLQGCEKHWLDTLNRAFGNYYALVIGINYYKHWEKLDTAVNNALTVADVLRNKYGFIIDKDFLLLDSNATYDNILKAINELSTRLTEHDNLLIYYAGHSHTDNDKKNLLAPGRC